MKLQLKRSLRLSNGAAQAPSAEQMSYGEIAVNYSDTDPSIFLKDSTNVIRKLAISSLPDTSSSTAQSGTLDDRYLMLSGGTVSGDVSATNFVGGVARVATSAPASASESELWFNSSTGRLYIRYGGQWVDASPDSFTMGTDFYSKTQANDAIAVAVSALENGAVATNAAAITALENGAVATNASAIATLSTGLASEESARLAAEADKMDVAGGTFTGPVSFNEDVIVKGGAGGSGEITLNCELNSHGVKLKGPAHSANASYTLTLPTSTGNSGEVLTTDGSGLMSWEEVVGNEISTSAPASPSQGALWTDTSEDPAAPILKTWNGSAWVAVGSAAPSEFAPVVNTVVLTENDPTGDRFTSQTFDVAIDMLIEGVPHSQKALKGEVTADFSVYPATEPVSSISIQEFPNNNQSSSGSLSRRDSKLRVYAPDTLGRWVWYWIHRDSGYYYLYGGTPDEPFGDQYYTRPQLLQYYSPYGSNQQFDKGRYYAPTTRSPWHYIVGENRYMRAGQDKVTVMRRPSDNSSDWVFNIQYDYRPPEYDEATDQYFSARVDGRNLYVDIGHTPFGTQTDSKNIGSGVADGDTLGIAVGNGRVVVWWRHYQTGYPYYYCMTTSGNYVSAGVLQSVNTNPGFLKFVGSYFIGFSNNQLLRSSDGVNWTNIGGTLPDVYPMDIYYNSGTGAYELYASASNDMKMLTSTNGGATWTEVWSNNLGASSFNNMYIQGGNLVFERFESNNFYEVWYPYNKQTVTVSGTGADYSAFSVYDVVRPSGTTGQEDTGVITNISGTSFEINSAYRWQVGDVIESTFASNSEVSTRYLVITATGDVTGTVGTDPGFVSVGPDVNQTLTFPATFPTGNTPDEELAAGTTIKVSVQATNSEGSSEFGPSNIVTPN